MEITLATLEDSEKALLQQQEQAAALHNQTIGALQLIKHLKAQLADALTEEQLASMVSSGQPNP